MSPVHKSLGEKPGVWEKQEILGRFFLLNANSTQIPTDWRFERYFEHYQRELELYNPTKYGKSSVCGNTIKTHADLLICFNEIRKDQNRNKSQVLENLRVHFPGALEPEFERVVELSLRIGLLLNVRSTHQAKLVSLKSFPIIWESYEPLKQLIGRQFPRSRWKLNANESRLHPRFTAAYMFNVCSLKIDWTDCLAHHLFLDRQNTTLYIFPHKACLVELLSRTDWSARKSNAGPIETSLSRTVLKETLMSLNLLFPHWDRASNTLLKLHKQNFHHYPPHEGPRTLSLMEFDHWRDRLLELHDVVFASPPASFRQLLLDRRNPQQFWTFWIAILILFLTILSTTASVYQAAKA